MADDVTNNTIKSGAGDAVIPPVITTGQPNEMIAALAEKRRAAALAMGGGLKPDRTAVPGGPASPAVVPSVATSTPAGIVPAAAVAGGLSGDVLVGIAIPKIDSLTFSKKRLDARAAMEGEARRKKREDEERAEQTAFLKEKMEKERVAKEAAEKERLDRERADREKRMREEIARRSSEIKEEVENIKTTGGGVSTIRTLKADMNRYMQKENVSVVSMAIKEEERKRQTIESEQVTSKTNVTLLIISILFIVAGLGLGGYVYYDYTQNGGQSVITQTFTGGPKYSSIIFTEKEVMPITIDDAKAQSDNARTIASEIKSASNKMNPATIEQVVFLKPNLNGGVKEQMTSQEFFSAIGARLPGTMPENINKDFMFGVYKPKMSENTTGFIILKPINAEAFDGDMYNWEKSTLVPDLYRVITGFVLIDDAPEGATSTAGFVDGEISSHHAMVYKDAKGITRIVYSIFDRSLNVAIIAGSEEAYKEIIVRYNTPKPVSN